MENLPANIVPLITEWGLNIIGAAAILIIGWIAAGIGRRIARRALSRGNAYESLVGFVGNMVYYVVIAFAVVAALARFGVQTTSFVAILGAAGFAVGFALQGSLANFASGVMLVIFRPFKIGDYIEAGGTAGTVQEIAIFSTTLHSPDNVRITVPNSGVYGSIVKNYSYNETRRNDMVFGISYDDDISKAVDVIQRALDGDDRVLKDPAPMIAVGELADSSVNLLVRPWCTGADYWGLRWDLTRKIKEDLEAAGCSIPYPQQDVYMHQVSAG